MDNKYVIYSEELTHHGIPGMKWGIRRYQNKDGSLTNAGKRRYEKELAKAKAEQKVIKNRERTKAKLDKLEEMKRDNAARKKALDDSEKSKKNENSKATAKRAKSVKDLSNEELSAIVERARLEQKYNELHPKKVGLGKKILNDVLAPSLTTSVKTLVGDFVTKKGKDFLGLNDKKDEDPLKKIVDRLDLEKRYEDHMSNKANQDLKKAVDRMDLEKRYEDHTINRTNQNLKNIVDRMDLEKRYKELSIYDPEDNRIKNEVQRIANEKRREELLKERKKKKED